MTRTPTRTRRRAATPPRPATAAATTAYPSLAGYQTLEQAAYRDIRRAIVDGSLAPGQRIVANTIAAATGISRIPVMQALRRLETEGFVRITPHKDVVVTSVSPEDSRERFLLMAALEALCIRESAGKITPAVRRSLREHMAEMRAARAEGHPARAVEADGRFHRLLWEIAGLPQVAQILQNIWDRGEYYRVIMHARRGGFAVESLAEHELILRALEDGDLPRAAKAVEHHRLRAMERLKVSSGPDDPGSIPPARRLSPTPARRRS